MIPVWTKIDVCETASDFPAAQQYHPIKTSAVSGEGIAELRRTLRQAALGAATAVGTVAATADRCRDSLRLALESLKKSHELVGDAGPEELVAAEVRIALDELGRMVGAVYSDDVLAAIFSRFCVGK
jgi:tRNA modification GTPase